MISTATTCSVAAEAIAPSPEAADKPGGTRQLLTLPLDRISIPATPMRSDIDAEALQSLAQSISVCGVLEPVLVRAADGAEAYELVAGGRRVAAARAAGVRDVPALLVEGDAGQALEIALIENIQREAMNPMDEARALARLRHERHLSVRKLAERLGKGRGWVDGRLGLLRLPEDLQQLVSGHPDSATHAREIDSVRDPTERRRLIEQAATGAMPLAEVRRQVRRARRSAKPAEAAARSAPPLILSEARDAGGADADFVADLLGDVRSLQRTLIEARQHINGVAADGLYRELETLIEQAMDVMALIEGRQQAA